ncbi:hypothetical protein [Aneurinibacillus aneurinilyticus]|uniref:Uncharacterized protein n=2 Tax=Aneurinibacillus aneurinilyticus TaxID=1391 RepID=A0A848CKF2_ANEAE|nr:hypothetical protein [Aneurinibacillus aneurinilyticus]ERI10638.1 hypothetical protein HMPREF0083_01267 [Aneurinibacillus aneurinilyticus ATCC 12856]MCI1696803.1 hypothetical protein [Aneurinibacillus aneurinilyticus]MED0673536.1 hypothetical protein [Aneurinibacillus aneurinilyticus]MED0705648.1 hypothetical protein [Aneurinibacillus aneurinilyticus]MED0724248.1 hypothetical protein [Aneurinibacillus aneurinilyticus]
MKQPVYLHKIVENRDKIIVRYTNFSDAPQWVRFFRGMLRMPTTKLM